MTVGTILVLLLLGGAVGAIVYRLRRDRKRGKCTCGCDCGSCTACHK